MDMKPKPKARNRKPGTPPFLMDPLKPRKDEQIGGGWFVFRRTAKTGRIRVPEWPFEHPNQEAAETERDRLSEKFPKQRFVVAQVPN